MIARLSLLFLFVLAPLVVSAQIIEPDRMRTGSFYSSIGMGAPADSYSSYSHGLGLYGVSVINRTAPSLSNPSHWGFIGITQAQISAGVTNLSATDGISDANNSLVSIDSFQFAFPLKSERLGLSVSFQPLTRSDYTRVEINEFQPNEFFDTTTYGVNLVGTGGINRFEMGLGYSFGSTFSIGYAASALIFSQREEAITAFSDTQFRDSRIVESRTGYSFGHRFGSTLRLTSLLREDDKFVVGSSLSLPVSIDADQSIRAFRNVNNQTEEVELNEGSATRSGTVEFPLEFNFGITYHINNVNSFTTELQFQNWSSAVYSYSSVHQGYYEDRLKMGVGYQYHAYARPQGVGFLSSLRYSVGATYDDGFLSISGQDIETYMLHAGVAIPSPRSRSSIDLSFNYGVRGTESQNLVKESIWGFKLSLNLAEFMFIRTRFQ